MRSPRQAVAQSLGSGRARCRRFERWSLAGPWLRAEQVIDDPDRLLWREVAHAESHVEVDQTADRLDLATLAVVHPEDAAHAGLLGDRINHRVRFWIFAAEVWQQVHAQLRGELLHLVNNDLPPVALADVVASEVLRLERQVELDRSNHVFELGLPGCIERRVRSPLRGHVEPRSRRRVDVPNRPRFAVVRATASRVDTRTRETHLAAAERTGEPSDTRQVSQTRDPTLNER